MSEAPIQLQGKPEVVKRKQLRRAIELVGPREAVTLFAVKILFFVVPAGFYFDGASIPRLFQWFLPRFGFKTLLASTLHDWLYINRPDIDGVPISRMLADALFREQLGRDGCSLVERWWAWLMVRAFGWTFWVDRWEHGPRQKLKRRIARGVKWLMRQPREAPGGLSPRLNSVGD